MYVRHQSRWIHPSYRNLVFEFLQRIEHRFNEDTELYFVHSCAQLDDAPFDFISTVVSAYPASQTQLIGSEDIQYFINLCQRRDQKPIPFVPRIDSKFYTWLMKDGTWQSEDLEAVVNQDVQRVYVQQGPVAARYSTKVNEPVKEILDGIYHGQIAALLERYYGSDRSKVPTVEYLGAEPVVSTLPPSVIVADSSSERVYYLPTDEALLPDHGIWINAICGPRKSWLHALLTAPLIFQGSKAEDNYIRRMLRPRAGQIVTIYGDDSGSVNEPVKEILDGIYHGQIAALLERYYGSDRSKVPTVEYLGVEPVVSTLPPSVIVDNSSSERVYYLPTDESLLPDQKTWISTICGPRKSWLHALLTAPLIFQGSKAEDNYVRRMMRPRTGQIVTIYGDDSGSVQSIKITRSSGGKDLDLAIRGKGVVVLNIYQPSAASVHALGLHFAYYPSQVSSPIHEIMEGRNDRIRDFYNALWLTDSGVQQQFQTYKPDDVVEVSKLAVTKKRVGEYCSVIGNRSGNYPPNSGKATLAPMDMLNIVSLQNMRNSITAEYVHDGVLNLVHLFNHIQYTDGARLLKIGDTVSCKSVISELANTDVGKRIIVDIQIYREGAQIAV
ncbi:DUF1729-domain-containing protein, partial [Martensiomyces pterosporus]